MIWDDPKDGKDAQRFKNMIFMKMFMTNDERDEAMPFIGWLMLAIMVGLGVYACVKG